MKNDDFEKQLSRVPMRGIPAEWRAGILLNSTQTEITMSASSPQKSGWRDLLWPSPLAWAALACFWTGILAVNIPWSRAQVPQHTDAATTPPDTLRARLAQERSLFENRGLF